jgi:hypothetical protein
MTIWQLANHIAGSRAYWFHDVLGEGDNGGAISLVLRTNGLPGLDM